MENLKAIVLGLLFAMCLSACAGGGGGGSTVAQGPTTTPDFTQHEFVFRVMSGTTNHDVQIRMQCNVNADAGYRDETSNLFFANQGQVGAVGCDQVYNVQFDVQNQDNADLYYEVAIDNVIVQSGTILGLQTLQYQNGYVQ